MSPGCRWAAPSTGVLDEYDQIEPTGRPAFRFGGQYAFTVRLPASRQGNDRDGRHYTIEVSATDQAGNDGPRRRPPSWSPTGRASEPNSTFHRI